MEQIVIDIKPAVAFLKAEIREAVRLAIDRCQAQIGVAPSAIEIRMVDVTTMADRSVKHYIVGDVEVRFDL